MVFPAHPWGGLLFQAAMLAARMVAWWPDMLATKLDLKNIGGLDPYSLVLLVVWVFPIGLFCWLCGMFCCVVLFTSLVKA